MTSRHGWLAVRVLATLAIAAGLGLDAYVHLDLADTYDVVRTSSLSQGDLFRIEAWAAILAGVALLIRPRRYTTAIAFMVAAGGFAAVLVYRYIDVGPIGPIPQMYEPAWYPEKVQATWAEGLAALLALMQFVGLHLQHRNRRTAAVDASPADGDGARRHRSISAT